METPPVGSLVVPSPAYRAAMETGDGAALLLALKRGSGGLFYPGTDRRFWVPMRDVRAIPGEAVPEQSLERLLSSLLLFVEAEECLVTSTGPGAMRLAIDNPGASREQLRELERLLGPRLDGYSIVPGSMRAVTLQIDLISLPEAADAGR